MSTEFRQNVSYYCASERHQLCTRSWVCKCKCHDGGGVREPRRPIPDEGGGKEQEVLQR